MATSYEVVRVDWFPHRRAEQLQQLDRVNPAISQLMREHGTVYLLGTLGFEAMMRPDGSVLVSVDEHWGEPDAPEPSWRQATTQERMLSIIAASERWPELAELIPQRPMEAQDCGTCRGQGDVLAGVYCGDCGALGWIGEHAT